VLSITSDGVRSSPVVRGVWILNNLLGSPPSPPPANVPDLEPDTRSTRTIREELARHREIESCNSCHQKIDPLGFALENYDAIGRWRTEYSPTQSANSFDAISADVDVTGVLPSGQKFQNMTEFKALLIDRKDAFRRCLAEKLLTYAVGRGLDLSDRTAVEDIVNEAAKHDDTLRELIVAVVQSEPFRIKSKTEERQP